MVKPQQIRRRPTSSPSSTTIPANKDKAYISLEIYDNKVATNILKTQIAAGNAPDIIGPVGVEGLNLFIDQLADLQPLIDSTSYDMSRYPAAMKDFFKIGKGGATIGVPFGTYPSFLWYNTKAFDEAKLPYPPTKVGDLYQGKPWDMNTVRDLAMKLTVDKATATTQPAPASTLRRSSSGASTPSGTTRARRAEQTLFGAGSFLADRRQDGPDPGHHAHRRSMVQRRRLEGPFHPDRERDPRATCWGRTTSSQSGNLAMNEVHTWYSRAA